MIMLPTRGREIVFSTLKNASVRSMMVAFLAFAWIGSVVFSGCKDRPECETVQSGEQEKRISGEMLSTDGCGRPFTPDEIFSDDPLYGNPPQGFKWSHDGRSAFFLKGSDSDAEILDLWVFDAENKKSRMLVAAADIMKTEEVELTEEQKAARERMRVRSRGITSFVPDTSGRGIVIPAYGMIYHYDLKTQEIKPLVEKPGGELDPKPSPDGTMVAFVRDGNLHVVNVHDLKERALTTDGSETLRNGVAEFVAAEELGRHTGYWWSPDGRSIAYAQVDESPVEIILRPEYSEDGVEVVRQRYPKAGTANAKVRLGVLDLQTARTRWVDMGESGDFYLVRVDWTKKGLAFQTLTRDLKRLSLRLANPETGRSRVVLEETDDHYINVHDDFHTFNGTRSESFLWSSEKSGNRQLYISNWKNGELKALTKEPLFVYKVTGINEEKGHVYASVPVNRGLELHLYRFCLDGKEPPVRITEKDGWHAVTMNQQGTSYFDVYSDLNVPPQVRIHDSSGGVLEVLDPNPTDRLEQYCLTPHEWVEFPAQNGVVLDGVLYYPVGYDKEKTHPAIIYTYGGPIGKVAARRWGRMDLWHRYMTQYGFFVLVFDGRGTGYRGKSFELEIYKGFGKVDVEDVGAAATWLGRRPDVDAKRLNLWGWSYGGYVTVMALLKLGNLFRSGAAVAPVADWGLYDTAYTERYLGHPEENPQIYQDANPMSFMETGLKSRLTLIHGMADDNVLLRHTLIMAEKLQDMGVMFDMMFYPGKRHSIQGRNVRKHLLSTLTRTLTKNDAKR